MKNRYAGVIVAEAIIIMLLLIGVAVLFVVLNGAAAAPSLPAMPNYNSIFSTNTALPTPFPISSINTPVNTPLPGTPTQTALPLYILNGTPIYPTSSNNSAARINSSITPSPVSVLVWTYTPTPSTNVPQGAPLADAPAVKTCKNILYPMAVGQQWHYQASAINLTDNLNMQVLSVNNSQGDVLLASQSTGSSKTVQVQCDGDVIRSFPFMSVDVLFGNTLSSDMTATYLSGVLAPNEAAFLQNNWALAWSSQYLVSGTTSINYNGTQVDITLDNSPATLTCQTLAAGDAAFETVTVAAGTFRALKVVCSEQGQATATVNGISVTGLVEGRSYQWFAPHIGLVKMQVEFATVKIFGISFSLPVNNSLELKSYISAP